jgi:hypothetical protein
MREIPDHTVFDYILRYTDSISIIIKIENFTNLQRLTAKLEFKVQISEWFATFFCVCQQSYLQKQNKLNEVQSFYFLSFSFNSMLMLS